MKLLLHSCCAPCLIYPYDELTKKVGTNITVFYFNPNIHPYKEFRKRIASLEFYSKLNNIHSSINQNYMLEYFLKEVLSRPAGIDRCKICYEIRLGETARFAKENSYDAFTTTLLVSPFQNHDLLHETGKKIAEQCNLLYLSEDFRSGFKTGREKAKDLNLYLQSYCGCIFSEEERYRKSAMKNRKKELNSIYKIK